MSRSRRLNMVRIALIVCGACVEVPYLRGCLLLLFVAFLDSGIRTLVGTTLCIRSSSHFRWASYSLRCWHLAFMQSGAENDSAFIFRASSNGSIDVLAKLRTRTGRHTSPVQCLEIKLRSVGQCSNDGRPVCALAHRDRDFSAPDSRRRAKKWWLSA